MTCVFTYGSLQIPEVMRAVTGSDFPFCEANLRQHIRRKLRGAEFPAIRFHPGGLVSGICWLGVPHSAVKKLDIFEGDYYRRENLKVEFADGSAHFAQTYVLRNEFYDLLLPEDWNLKIFRRFHLASFLAQVG